MGRTRSRGQLLDALFEVRALEDAVDVDAGGVDGVLVERADRDELLDLGHGDLAGGGHHRIEVPRGLPVDQVALGVALPGLDDGEVGGQAALHHIEFAVELAHLLALGHQGADAGLGEEGGDAGAAGPDALGQGALRVELQLQLARQVELLEQLVLADVGADHLVDLAVCQQQAEAEAVDAAIVGDDRQATGSGVADRGDQVFGDAAKAEAAGHDGHAVEQHAREGGGGVLSLFRSQGRFSGCRK